MHACQLLCPAMPMLLLLALLASRPTTATVAASSNTSSTPWPCAPAPCGNLTIAYPFWLAGAHGPECGYRAFEVACEEREVYLKKSYWRYKVLGIYYEDSSFAVSNVDLLTAGPYCDLTLVHNASSDLGIGPFRISSRNQELFVLTHCRAPATQLPPSWAHVECSAYDTANSFAWLAGNYSPDDILKPLPGNCTVSLMPVLGYKGAVAAQYRRLLGAGFLLEHDYTNEDCAPCTETGGQCRVDVGKDVISCHCSDGVHSAVCGSKRAHGKIKLLIVLMAATASFLFPCIYILAWHQKGRRLRFLLGIRASNSTERNIEALIVSYGSLAPKRYSYSEVMKITSSLNDKLGKGGYGVVYKGRLLDGHLVAVKFLHDCKGQGGDFVNEVMSIGRTSHVNIVSLFGFCLERSKRALIYEYMPNGSLDQYIYCENPKGILGWQKLYNIAVGIARGLEYLHHSCNTRIVHFDIKPQNILLDQDFCPKIADFGLAKLCHTKESKLSVTGTRGTIGFIAPEVHSRTFGVVSTKSDVYSYGMMLLEMVGGRKNVKSIVDKSSQKYFPDWIYDHFAHDDGLEACKVTCEVEDIAKKMILIGLWCVQVLPMSRPTISKVLEMFERDLDELDMPPKQNFSQKPLESINILNVEGTSFNSLTQTQAFSEVLKINQIGIVNSKNQQIGIVNSKNLQRLPTL